MIYDDLDTLFRARGLSQRADGSWLEDSYDYGVWWKDDVGGVYRLTWIGPQWRDDPGRAGELYAVRLSGPHVGVDVALGATVVSVGGAVGVAELLCRIPPSDEDHADARVEALLEGWAEVCGAPRSLDWVRDRAGEAVMLWGEP